MHLSMILLALVIAWIFRLKYTLGEGAWENRWHRALLVFLLPPLLILSTAIALLCMGGNGQMMGLPSGWMSYAIATLFLTYSLFLLLRSSLQGFSASQKISSYSTQTHLGTLVYVLQVSNIFAAQIGFWQPRLVVSQGLLDEFDSLHLNAVLKHEEAHLFYRDTFWFFGLGCLRQITQWLPNTEMLWQELLLLRELRADRWATKQVDTLVLAESLLWSVCDMSQSSDSFSVALNGFSSLSRLEERIEMLLGESQESEVISNKFPWGWLALTALPLTSVLLHS
jgi:Zn-dependent protease with chaperone function